MFTKCAYYLLSTPADSELGGKYKFLYGHNNTFNCISKSGKYDPYLNRQEVTRVAVRTCFIFSEKNSK